MRKLPQAQELFIECMGLAAEAEGLPRIAGYMNGLFFLLGNPFSFSEPAGRLRVSRASVSINARILRDLGIIERISRPGVARTTTSLPNAPSAAC
ncbi:MAG: hypothetical protein ABI475_05865 [Methylophilaceae bacterium]